MTKEEKKDEMKNRISMALKDPILQQGFEIICKNLEELETENNKLLDVINNQDVKIADLEKKNAELKEKLNFSTQYYQGEKAKEHLTKAKEIIREIMKYDIPTLDYEKAEQFLKEIEK